MDPQHRAPYPTGGIEALRDLILDGQPVQKDRVIRDVTVDCLNGIDQATTSRDVLVNELFLHVRGWIRMVNALQGHQYRYSRLTAEQVALIIVRRHCATTVSVDAVPSEWAHYPHYKRREQVRNGRVIGVWVNRTLNVNPSTPLDLKPGYYTSPLIIGALSAYYSLDSTIAERGRVRTLLHQWAPRYPTAPAIPATSDASKEV